MVEPAELSSENLAGLADTLSALARVVLSEETLDAVLATIVGLAVSAIPDVCGASVSVARNDRFFTAIGSSDLIRDLDALQYATDNGPCVEATRTGRRQHEQGGALQERWGTFGAAALAAGITSMLSVPLHAGDRTVGALNLYSTSAHAFGRAPAELASVFAHHAAAVLSNATAYADAASANTHLQEALRTRQVIGQAMGIIMAREGCTSADAFEVLRRASQQANVKLRVVAEGLVRSIDSTGSLDG